MDLYLKRGGEVEWERRGNKISERIKCDYLLSIQLDT